MSEEEYQRSWIEAELEETLGDLFEAEFNQPILTDELRKIYKDKHPDMLDRRTYYSNLLRLQSELVKLQDWVEHTKSKVLIICEGRDSAGKGGVIKRITQRMNPRVARVVAHLPAGGEIVFFDRSWYNRAGVERVMGFASDAEVDQFFHDVPEFERMLVRSGIIVLKYWFSITDEEQQLRFLMRIHDPMKQWKLSAMDLESRIRWEDYTRAKEDMFAKTNIPEAPWYIVEGNDKKRERLNCIEHILSQIPYQEIPFEKVDLPNRVFNPDYERRVLPDELYVPKVY